ncbi:MAG TPA: hypothetical protein VJN21_05030 [Candidatus Acidoferrales bacterium]|nr:hypothetical protein [Candidatus Acidoferrales bacterium]
MGLSFLAILLFGFALPPQQAADCLACHSDKTLQDPAGHSVYVDEEKRKASVHGSLGCTDCHADIKEYPHPEHPSAVQCGTCHSSEAEDLAVSIHAEANPQPCLGCHGDPHGIAPVRDASSPVYPLNIPRTCGSCHGNPEIAKRFNLPNVYAM